MTIKSLSHSSLTDNLFYRSMLAGNTAYVPPPLETYEHLQTYELSSAQSSIVFNNVNSYTGYEDLQLRFFGRDNRSDYSSQLNIQFNGDTGYNYWSHGYYGWGTTPGAWSNSASGNNRFTPDILTGGNAEAYTFGAGIIEIIHAFKSDRKTMMRFLGGMKQDSGFNPVIGGGGIWNNNAAITSITLYGMGTMQPGTRAALYGRRAS